MEKSAINERKIATDVARAIPQNKIGCGRCFEAVNAIEHHYSGPIIGGNLYGAMGHVTPDFISHEHCKQNYFNR